MDEWGILGTWRYHGQKIESGTGIPHIILRGDKVPARYWEDHDSIYQVASRATTLNSWAITAEKPGIKVTSGGVQRDMPNPENWLCVCPMEFYDPLDEVNEWGVVSP